MTRKYAPVLAAIVLACPQSASALALGDLRVRSNLNEPLDAEIELLAGEAEEVADLRAALASVDEFRRAGVERPYVLTRLRFRVEDRPGGKAAIRISTKQPVREPFLNFLLELNWPQGRLVREYTVLLDPPVYGAAAAAAVRGPVLKAEAELPAPAPAPAPRAAAPAAEPAAAPVVERSVPRARTEDAVAPAPAAPADGTRESYGPVAAGDTLWAIANQVRPDRGVSTQQMMVALLRANPEAFVQDNVNLLKAGSVLRVPDRQSVESVDQAAAVAEIRRHQTVWEDYRQGVARSPRPEPVAGAAPVAARQAPPAAPAEAPARLEITGAGGESGGAGAGSGTEDGALRKEVALLQEELDGRRQEVTELQARLAEAEALIQDLQRLIQLKDETLAALQQQALLTQARAEAAGEEGQVEVPAPAVAGAVALAFDEPKPVLEAPAEEADSGAQPASPAVGDAPVAAAGAAALAFDEPKPVTEVPAPEAGPSAEPAAAAPGEARAAAAAPPAPAQAPAEPQAPPAPAAQAPAEPQAPPAPAAQAVLKPASPAAPALPAAPVERPSLLDSLAATSPVFWGGVAGVLALVGGLLSVRRRRPAESPAEPAAFAEEPSTTLAAQAAAFEPASETSLNEARAARPEPTSESSRAEDPMAEVNVYLAYERFDQAEEVVRRAIAEHPDRPEYLLKLLEVHHAAKDAGAFERDAAQLRGAVGEASPLMERARAWWSELVPGRPLALAGAAGAAALAAGAPELERTLIMTVDEIRAAASPSVYEEERIELPAGEVDFDLGLDLPAEERTSEPFDFDLDLGQGAESPKEESVISAVDLDLTPDPSLEHAVAEATEALDLDLDADARRAHDGPSGLDLELTRGGELALEMGDGLDLELTRGGELALEKGDGLDLDLDAQGARDDNASGERAGLPGSAMDLSLEPLSSEVSTVPPPSALATYPSEDSGFGIEPDLSAFTGGGRVGERAEVAAASEEDLAPAPDAAHGTEPVMFTGTVPLGDDLSEAGAEVAFAAEDLDGASDLGLDTGPAPFTGTVPLSEELEAQAADHSGPAGASTLTLFGPYLQAEESEPATAASSEAGIALEPPEQALSLEPGPAEVAAFAVSAEPAAFDEGAFSEPADLADALEGGAPVSEAEMVVAPPAPSGGVPEEVFATLVSAQVPGVDADALLPPGVDFELETDLAADGAEEASLFLGEDDSTLEEIDTKLDLARAYIDMGDSDGARGILSEVLSEGNDTQRGEAEDLLTRLA